jgi:hypothetical protein
MPAAMHTSSSPQKHAGRSQAAGRSANTGFCRSPELQFMVAWRHPSPCAACTSDKLSLYHDSGGLKDTRKIVVCKQRNLPLTK